MFLTEKEKLIIHIANNIELDNSEKYASTYFAHYAPEGKPTGRLFSRSFKPVIKKGFWRKKYFLLFMQCGESEINGYMGHVTEWCEVVYKFKNEMDFYLYLEFIKIYIAKKNTSRLTLEEISSR